MSGTSHGRDGDRNHDHARPTIDLPRITLETVPANLRVVENATQSSVIVRATTAAPVKAETTVTLTVGASGDGATKTTDYTASNVGTITLRANGPGERARPRST